MLSYYTFTKGIFRGYRKIRCDFQPITSARQHTTLYTGVQQYSVQYSVRSTDRCAVAVEVWWGGDVFRTRPLRKGGREGPWQFWKDSEGCSGAASCLARSLISLTRAPFGCRSHQQREVFSDPDYLLNGVGISPQPSHNLFRCNAVVKPRHYITFFSCGKKRFGSVNFGAWYQPEFLAAVLNCFQQ